MVFHNLEIIFRNLKLYSLYSTATQNTCRRGLALGNAPDARILRWRYQHVGIFWLYPRRQSPTPILKFALPPTPSPDASQWNIGGVGPSGVGAGVGHVHFMLFMSISFASGTQRKLVFQWNMGLNMFTVLPSLSAAQFFLSTPYIYSPYTYFVLYLNVIVNFYYMFFSFCIFTNISQI